MKTINGYKVADNLYEPTMLIIREAWKDKINLMVGCGTRTYDEQLSTRRANVIDKTKVTDLHYLETADNGLFLPRTAMPGTSNHELDDDNNSFAIDFKVNGNRKVYEWLVKNAHKYGWVRTVPSERWHWEFRPTWDRFIKVPKTHETWDGLL